MTASTAVTVAQIRDHITELLTTKYHVPAAEAVPGAVLDDLDIDSMTLVEIALAAEAHFHISIPDEVLRPSHTIDEAAHAAHAAATSAS